MWRGTNFPVVAAAAGCEFKRTHYVRMYVESAAEATVNLSLPQRVLSVSTAALLQMYIDVNG